MATNTMVMQLVVMLTVAMTTTLAVKTLRLKTIGRARGYNQPQLSTVIGRIDQLTSLVNDLQTTVDEMFEMVNVINNTVDPTVISRFSFISSSYIILFYV